MIQVTGGSVAASIELPQLLYIDENAVPAATKKDVSVIRLLFVLYAAIGVICGVAAGISLAAVTGQVAVATAAYSTQATSIETPAGSPPITNAAPAQYLQPTAPIQLQSVSIRKMDRKHLAHFRSRHGKLRMAAISTPATVSSNASSRISQVISNKQYSRENNGLAPSAFYVEGDVQVVDYDANAGTIGTNIGKHFVVDSASFSEPASWGDDRIDVHYRCGQSGNCVLQIPGAGTFSAKMI